MQSTALQKVDNQPIHRPSNAATSQALSLVQRGNETGLTFSEAKEIGEMFAQSGLFKDVRGAAQCVVKILAGQEMGIPPYQAMNALHVIEGKPTLAAQTIGAMIKRSGRYDYRVTRWDNRGCFIDFYERGERVGVASFTEADARAAKLLNKDNWNKYPDAMYFARAISKGARAYCPDVFGGAIYTPEEMGVEVDAEGAPLNQGRPYKNPISATLEATALEATAASPAPLPLHQVDPEILAKWQQEGRITEGKHQGRLPDQLSSEFLERILPVVQKRPAEKVLARRIKEILEARHARNEKHPSDIASQLAEGYAASNGDELVNSDQESLPVEDYSAEDAATDAGLPQHVRQVWGAVNRNGLPQNREGQARERRIHATNRYLLDYNMNPVDSFSQLSAEAADVIITGLDAGTLKWD